MVSQITLGNFGTQNGRSVVTGSASGFDTTSIVDSLVKAKRQPAVLLETADATIDKKTKAYTDMKNLLTKLQSAADTLRNASGVGNASSNSFEYRTSTVTSNTGGVASNFLDATVEPGAVVQAYTIDSISQLAKQTKQQTGNITVANDTTASAVSSSATAGLFKAGTVNLRAVDGTVGGVAVTLNAGDSLQTVAAKFNEVSSRTGIQATVLNVASGSYKIVFSATKTGSTYGFDMSATAGSAGAGITSDSSGVMANLSYSTTQGAQNAIFSIDGVSVTRETNSVSDAITGVTFNLKQATGTVATPNSVTGSLLVSVSPDVSIVSSAITAFADAYNAFKLFASNQSQLDDTGAPKDTSVLYNENTFRTILSNVNAELTRSVGGITNGDPTLLADVGISIDNFAGDDTNPATKNILTVNTDKLKSALESNFQGVRNLFEYNETSDNVNFVNYKRSNNLDVTSFSMNINQTAGTYVATYTDSAGTTQTVNFTGTSLGSSGGISLTGPTGSVFEGSQFVFAGTGNATVNVSLSQGYADRFYNMMDQFINTTDGLITQETTTLADTKTRNQEEVTKIDDKLTAYRDQLLQQYSSLEAALTSANNILQLLTAQANARNSSGN